MKQMLQSGRTPDLSLMPPLLHSPKIIKKIGRRNQNLATATHSQVYGHVAAGVQSSVDERMLASGAIYSHKPGSSRTMRLIHRSPMTYGQSFSSRSYASSEICITCSTKKPSPNRSKFVLYNFSYRTSGGWMRG